MNPPHQTSDPNKNKDNNQQTAPLRQSNTQNSNLLTVPASNTGTASSQLRRSLAPPYSESLPIDSQASQFQHPSRSTGLFRVLPSQPVEQDPPDLFDYDNDLLATLPEESLSQQQQARILGTGPLSTYSSSSQESVYSTPGPQYYNFSTLTMNNQRTISKADKDQLIKSLRTHRVNTLTELRRIEKVFAYLDQTEVCEPMTSAWAHYVNSNNLLSELRGLTRNYPFSSECLDEAKWKVIEDPASTRSWNYCWLVLVKIQNESLSLTDTTMGFTDFHRQLITKHARSQAALPKQWGGRKATSAGINQLADAFIAEWTWALGQMLRHWESPPTTTGR
ncbi:MAG: hypothetical protein M1835_003951 [Candelina submexicana]|nr:MAG: hypothetical protein M1835_003951 [Candelina submexicana]